MKLLMAITSNNPKQVTDRALRWCARTGHEMRLFVPQRKRTRYMTAIADANYDFYLNIKHDQVISDISPDRYAQRHGFELLVTVPEELWSWRINTHFKDNEILHAVKAIAKARLEFEKNPRKRIKHFANGVTIQRVRNVAK